jgi:histidine ammonia-lyase
MSVQSAVRVDGRSLTLQDIWDVAVSSANVAVDPTVKDRLDTSADFVRKEVEAAIRRAQEDREAPQGSGAESIDAALDRKRLAIYGVTTGFGALKGNFLQDEESARQLQENIILSHSAGVGEPFDEEVTRAVMLVRANTLASGYCGVRFCLLEQLVRMLNAGVLPVIPEQGSVGASGDLAPLAHLGLGLIGKGPVRFQGQVYSNIAALKSAHGAEASVESLDERFQLSFKEGLALVNGLALTTAIAALNIRRASQLLLWADVIGSMTAEAIKFAPRAFDPLVFDRIYGHQGAKVSAAIVRRMTVGSGLMNQSPDVHDPYSVRCLPQVHGAARDVLRFVASTVSNHLHTVDDDPVFFSSEQVRDCPPEGDGWMERLHFEHGHFHGAPLGYGMDFVAISMTDLSSISERRTAMLVDANHNRGGGQVPGFLTVSSAGATSGLMIAQCTAAALVSENKTLSHPASVDSIPTSASSEDHVSMATIAARKARKIIANTESVLAVELLSAAIALAFRTGDLRAPGDYRLYTMGAGTREVYDTLRSAFDGFRCFDGRDTTLYDKIAIVRQLMGSAPPTKAILGT